MFYCVVILMNDYILQLVTISEYYLSELTQTNLESDSSGIGSGDDDVISNEIGAIYRAKVGMKKSFISISVEVKYEKMYVSIYENACHCGTMCVSFCDNVCITM